MEECIADCGLAMILADLGIAVHPRPDHAAYIASWLEKWRARHFSSNHHESVM